MPEISVILPVFNAEGFISDSVQSILSQSFKDFELILIDDASHDNTSKILDALADERIRHIRHDKNMGLVFSLNEGLNLARGNFIARMDHDDIAFPCRFAKQLKFFMDNQSVGLPGNIWVDATSEKGSHNTTRPRNKDLTDIFLTPRSPSTLKTLNSTMLGNLNNKFRQ